MDSPRATIGDWLPLFRPRNYPNYLVVVVAALAVCDGAPPVRALALEFLWFGVCLYSGIYILNEVLDADLDRLHPVKRDRSVPSGRIPAWQAVALAGALWVVAFAASAPVYYPLYLGFIAVNLAYSLFIKRRGFRNLIAVTSALRVSLGFVVAGKGVLHDPGLMVLCTLYMASVQQAKFGVEGTLGSRHTGAKLLGFAALMVPVSAWCWSRHPVVVAWTDLAMVIWVFIPWRSPRAARWLIGADVPEPRAADAPLPAMVVFDVDGTLCDSMAAILQAVNELAPTMGFPPITAEQHRAFRGLGIRQIQRALGLRAWQLARLGRHTRRVLYERIGSLKPIAGVAAELHGLRERGYRLAIVSSNQRKNVEAFVRAHGIDLFDELNTHRGWGSGLWRKRRQLRALMDTWQHQASRFVYVCDEIRDIEAARAVQMPVIAVSWGANSAEALAAAGPTMLIDSPSQLAEAVRLVFAGAPDAAPPARRGAA